MGHRLDSVSRARKCRRDLPADTCLVRPRRGWLSRSDILQLDLPQDRRAIGNREVIHHQSDLQPTEAELRRFFWTKYGDPATGRSVPRLRHKFGCYSPDDFYELLVEKLVGPDTRWMDVGCGRNIFPSNSKLARRLADHCELLVGVDPDETLEDNTFVHRKLRSSIEQVEIDEPFNLITLRMVAEHVVEPERVLENLRRLTAVGGLVVIYTVNKWSPASIIAKLTPMGVHHTVKRFLWRTDEKDTFPVAYKMNTRKTLAALFEKFGFRERHFAFLDDTRTSNRFPALQVVELSVRNVLRFVGSKYPENCLLGVYERIDRPQKS